MSGTIRVSWSDVANHVRSLIDTDLGTRDLIVGIARGGLPIATYMANKLAIGDIAVAFARTTVSDEAFAERSENVRYLGVASPCSLEGRRILVVDDIVRSGATAELVFNDLGGCDALMVALRSYDRAYPFPLRSAGFIDDQTWVSFPWEV